MSVKFFVILSVCSLYLTGCPSSPKRIYMTGMASWYGDKYHGRKTANGETYNMNEMTAAHPKLPFGTRVKVVAQNSKRSAVVRINDRGPFAKNRIIDVSKAAAKKLEMVEKGAIMVNLQILNK